MKIVEYKVIQAEKKYLLEEFIVECMQEGWQPFEGISYAPATFWNGTEIFTQAVVKYQVP